MKYVLYCHSGSANHGCEALARTIATLLQPAKVVVLSDAPEEDGFYGVDELAEPICAVSKPRRRDWIKAYAKLKLNRDYFYMDAIPYFPALDIIEKDDIAVSIGGDIYCYDHYPKYMYINREVRRRAAKTILLGCSVEPELLRDPKLCEDLKQFDLITARESITYEALKQINPNTVLLPDSAFLLEKTELPLPPNFQPGNTVGINLSPLVLRKAKDQKIVMQAFEKLIEYIISDTDMSVALIPHVVWEDNDDRNPLSELYGKYASTGRATLIEDHNCSEIKGYIARCRFFIGARTHSTIAAYSSGVPTLVIGYSVKARGIARDLFGAEDGYVLPVQDIGHADDIVAAFKPIIENECALRGSLESKKVSSGEVKNILRKFGGMMI